MMLLYIIKEKGDKTMTEKDSVQMNLTVSHTPSSFNGCKKLVKTELNQRPNLNLVVNHKVVDYINMYLNAVAKSTSESINNKYNYCINHQMILNYIGTGKIDEGITLLNKYYLKNKECNKIGYIISDNFVDVYIPDLAEKIITEKELYNIQNIHWITEGLVDFQSSLSQWFIKSDGNFHKAALDALWEQFQILIDSREYVLSILYHPLGNLYYGKWLDNCYYLLLKIENRNLNICTTDNLSHKKTLCKNNREKEIPPVIGGKQTGNTYDTYFLQCSAWG